MKLTAEFILVSHKNAISRTIRMPSGFVTYTCARMVKPFFLPHGIITVIFARILAVLLLISNNHMVYEF